MLDSLSTARDSTVLFALSAGMAIVAIAFALGIGPEYATVPGVLTAGSVVFAILRRRDGD